MGREHDVLGSDGAPCVRAVVPDTSETKAFSYTSTDGTSP